MYLSNHDLVLGKMALNANVLRLRIQSVTIFFTYWCVLLMRSRPFYGEAHDEQPNIDVNVRVNILVWSSNTLQTKHKQQTKHTHKHLTKHV
jgi:hypothetical protein